MRISPRFFPVLALVLATGLPASVAAREPVDHVRDILRLQDLMAQGDHQAAVKRNEAIRTAADAFAAAADEEWSKPKNVQAVIVYVLSGGDPSPVLRIARRGVLKDIDSGLIVGALSFADGRDKQASLLLAEFDTQGLSDTLGAAVALAQANLVMREDKSKAIERLDQVRLKAPGTFMEETALRQQSLLLLESGDVQRSARLAARHARRFPKSLFTEVFHVRFVTRLIERKPEDATADVETVRSQFAAVAPVTAAQFFIGIAREGLRQRRFDTASKAAQVALDFAPSAGAEHDRAVLYSAAIDAVTERAATARATLESLSIASLSHDEAKIRTSAMAIAAEVRGDRPTVAAQPAVARDDQAPKRENNNTSAGAMRQRAIQALQASNDLLAGARP
jgi:chemotaxis protein MotC